MSFYHPAERGSSMKLFIIANWKSNKTTLQAEEWFGIINRLPATFNKEEKEVIICPPFTILSEIESEIKNYGLGFKVGAQDISPFDTGSYTGEVSALLLKEFANYVIIGHSERRKNFLESDEMLFKKVELAKQYGLIPIFCVQGKQTKIPSSIDIIAYEPIDAIGTGHPETAENAQNVASFFKNKHNISHILYGGSVTSENVKSFTKMPNIAGVLVGGASLDAKEFYTIIQNA